MSRFMVPNFSPNLVTDSSSSLWPLVFNCVIVFYRLWIIFEFGLRHLGEYPDLVSWLLGSVSDFAS